MTEQKEPFPFWISKPLIEIAVEDIYHYGKSDGLERFAVTKLEAREIFDRIDKLDWDCENDSFWSFVEHNIEKYLKEKRN